MNLIYAGNSKVNNAYFNNFSKMKYQTFDTDAVKYIKAVEIADGQSLEPEVAFAINDFVVGCKIDGIWDAIKASCILMGARTLSGALVPLVGSAPTNVNFVSGDYNRKTGLVGNGSSKELLAGRNANDEPQNNVHISCFVTERETALNRAYLGAGNFGTLGSTFIETNSPAVTSQINFFCRTNSFTRGLLHSQTGLLGMSRSSGTTFSVRFGDLSDTLSSNSQSPVNAEYRVFSLGSKWGSSRQAFYSFGESLDLALLDTRVSDLYTAIGAAIP